MLHDQLSAGVVKENRAALHFCDRFFIDKSRVFGRQVAVERHHIRLRKQGIQINILADGMAGIVGIDIVCQNAHAHRLCDSAFGLSDASKADDANGFARQFNERIIPIAPVGICSPVSVVDRRAVMADMVADLQQQSNRELTDRCCSIGRHVDDRNALFPCVLIVHNVIARRKDCNQPDIRARINRRAGDRRLIHNDDFRIANALRDQRGFCIRCAVINGQFSKRLQPFPTQIAGVFRISVQYYKLHSSPFLYPLNLARLRTGNSDLAAAAQQQQVLS